MKENFEKASKFLQEFVGRGRILVTAISPDKKDLDTKCYDTLVETGGVDAFLYKHNGKSNIYFSVNQPIEKANKRCKKTDIKSSSWLHVDVDPRAGEDMKEEQERILKKLQAFSPRPTVILFSGGGYQAFWALEDPVMINGDEEKAKEIELRNLQLEHELDGDHCHNIERIMRVPFTLNIPDAKKKKAGRKQTWADLIEFDKDAVYKIDEFPKAQAVDTGAQTRAPTTNIDLSGEIKQLDSVDDLDEWGVSDRVKSIIKNGSIPGNPKKNDNSRSSWQFDGICECVRKGVPHDVMYSFLTDKRFKISECILDKKNPKKYAIRQIERAQEFASNFMCGAKSKRPISNQQNIRKAIRKLGYNLSYDKFSNRLLVNGKFLDEAEIKRIYLEVDRKFEFLPKKELFWMVVEVEARENSFHPVEQYLNSLQWDGIDRLDTWLIDYCGAKNSVYIRSVGKIMFVAAVRRIFQPGVKFDEMVVLESATQGKSKSELFAVMAVNEEWFTDNLELNMDTKRQIETIKGRWIIEVPELEGMRKYEVEKIKSLLSRQKDIARLAYDRNVSEYPRQCIIVGTTNREVYLRDSTGNRRFWPVSVEKIDIDAFKKDIHQLYAEAVCLEKQGFSIRLNKALWSDAAFEQEKRYVEDPFETIIADAIGDQNGKIRALTVWDIVELPKGHRNQSHNCRIGEAMTKLGFKRTKLRFGGPPEWCYVRGTKREQKNEIKIQSPF